MAQASVSATAKRLRISPRKLNLVAQLIRRKPVGQAVQELANCRKRVAQDVYKCLVSAMANAENNHAMDVDNLVVNEAFVGNSFSMRRLSARAKGRGNQLRKPFAHLTITLVEKAG